MYGPTTHTRLVEMWMVSPTTNSQETASATNKHKPYSDVNEMKYSCIITMIIAINIIVDRNNSSENKTNSGLH